MGSQIPCRQVIPVWQSAGPEQIAPWLPASQAPPVQSLDRQLAPEPQVWPVPPAPPGSQVPSVLQLPLAQSPALRHGSAGPLARQAPLAQSPERQSAGPPQKPPVPLGPQ